MTKAGDGLPPPQRLFAAAAIALGIALSVIDGTIANIALPVIARSLNVDPAQSIWVVNSYQLAVTLLLLPFSALGDIVGYRRIYLSGLGLFTLASLFCAQSDSLLALTAARFVQGIGAAGIMSVGGALTRFIYPQAGLGRGLAINAMAVSVSAAAGPTIAGGILSVADWPWLFAVNVPLGLLALLVAWRALPQTPRAAHKFDAPGAAFAMLSVGLLVGGIDSVGHDGLSWLFALELAGFALAITLLIRREQLSPVPILPVDLLRIPIFTLSISTSVCAFTAQMLALVSLPFLLQLVHGYSAVETGLLMTSWPLATAAISPIAGRLADRYPAGLLGGIGLVFFAAGMSALALAPEYPSAGDLVWRMALAGIGFGLFQSPNNRAILTSAPRQRSGGANGMLATARLLGQTLGASLTALIFARFSVEGGSSIALAAAACFALIAATVSASRLWTVKH